MTGDRSLTEVVFVTALLHFTTLEGGARYFFWEVVVRALEFVT